MVLDWNKESEEYTLFASSETAISEAKYKGVRYYKSKTASDLVSKAKVLKPDKWWNKEEGKAYKIVLDWGNKYVWEGIYTNGAYKRTETATSKPNWGKLPSLNTPWEYWHAFYVDKEELVEKGPVITSQTESLWYNGMYKNEEK